jgi:hypothetical protein
MYFGPTPKSRLRSGDLLSRTRVELKLMVMVVKFFNMIVDLLSRTRVELKQGSNRNFLGSD